MLSAITKVCIPEFTDILKNWPDVCYIIYLDLKARYLSDSAFTVGCERLNSSRHRVGFLRF